MTTELPDRPSPHTTALDEQIAYYATRSESRLLPLDTPYIHRHFRAAMNAMELPSGATVCEWGSGLGRFSRLLLAEGFNVTAIELSPRLADTARQTFGSSDERLSIRCGDIAEVIDSGIGEMDAVIGFFVLHHLPELDRYFHAARRCLRAGGRMVFVEPNPFHPFYPVQIGFSPGMRWSAERGIYRLTPRRLRAAAAAVGFSDVRIARYGALPPVLYNWAATFGGGRLIESLLPDMVKAFQLITLVP